MTPAIPGPDAVVCAAECYRGMDSFDTLPLITPPLVGVVLVIATVIASLLL